MQPPLMLEGEAQQIRVNHPDFRFVGEQAINGFPYVVFERNLYNKPTPEQIADYRHRQETVESLGGYMRLREHEIAGETPLFTPADVVNMRKAIEAALPKWEAFDSWNGTGCRSCSIAIRPKTKKEE